MVKRELNLIITFDRCKFLYSGSWVAKIKRKEERIFLNIPPQI